MTSRMKNLDSVSHHLTSDVHNV